MGDRLQAKLIVGAYSAQGIGKYFSRYNYNDDRNLEWKLNYKVKYGQAIYICIDDKETYRMTPDTQKDIWSFKKNFFQSNNTHWYYYYVGSW